MCDDAEMELLGFVRKPLQIGRFPFDIHPNNLVVRMDKDMCSPDIELPKAVRVRFNPFVSLREQTIKFV
jgi:hypothetical protein